MASKSRARREAAKARQGTYQRSEVGRASARAREHLRARVGKTDTYHHQRMFHSLDRAQEFAGDLPNSQASYIIGTGEYRNPDDYNDKEKGGAALNSWSRGNMYKAFPEEAKEESERIFKEGTAKTYYVRWKDI